MKVSIYRKPTANCNHRVLMGEFNDLHHFIIFIKGSLLHDLGEEMIGAYVVEYDFGREGEE